MPGAVVLIVVGLGISVAIALAARGGGSGPTPTPVATPLGTPTASASPLAPISTIVTGQPVDGIECQTSEQVLFHIHAHLAVFVNGAPRVIPEGIGIMPPRQEVATANGPFVTGGSCFYWLHAHSADGVIHIESPVQRTYTLGNYFDIWGIPLDGTHVGPASGTVIAYVDGARYSGDVRAIPLDAHSLIQLDVGTDVAPVSFTFAPGL